MCGEKVDLEQMAVALTGSPPRVRGKDWYDPDDVSNAGITPACAGKRVVSGRKFAAAGDHPRVCGEKSVCWPLVCTIWGSPPRVRGKEGTNYTREDVIRITPACAGKSCTASKQRPSTRDHPRVCGEKQKLNRTPMSAKGSPPRVRGKGFITLTYDDDHGITPACAGKRKTAKFMILWEEDHPRVCGEKSGLFRSNATGTGSPPRVRGKEYASTKITSRAGITPACAGKSVQLRLVCYTPFGDHPRVCGEKSRSGFHLCMLQGSPPRVRGKARSAPIQYVFTGITPACAGKRHSARSPVFLLRDHPRVCGEKTKKIP